MGDLNIRAYRRQNVWLVRIFVGFIVLGGVLAAFSNESANSPPYAQIKYALDNGLYPAYRSLFGSGPEAASAVHVTVCLNLLIVVSYHLSIILFIKKQRKKLKIKVDEDIRHYEHEVRWADSVYFLGFILTLVALIIALSTADFANGDRTMGAVIVQNAYALSSTVVALIIRTVWINRLTPPRQDTTDPLAERIQRLALALDNLDTANARTARNVNRSADEIATLGERIKTTHEEIGRVAKAFSGLAGKLEEETKKVDADAIMKELAERLATVADGLRRSIDDVAMTIRVTGGDTGKAFTEVAAALRSKGGRAGGALEAAADRLGSVDVGGVVRSVFERAVEPAQEAADRSGLAFAKATEAINESTASLSASLKNVSSDAESLSASIQSINTVSNHLQGAVTHIEAQMVDGAEKIVDRAGKAILYRMDPALVEMREMAGQVSTLAKSLDELVAALRKARDEEVGRRGVIARIFRKLFRKG